MCKAESERHLFLDRTCGNSVDDFGLALLNVWVDCEVRPNNDTSPLLNLENRSLFPREDRLVADTDGSHLCTHGPNAPPQFALIFMLTKERRTNLTIMGLCELEEQNLHC